MAMNTALHFALLASRTRSHQKSSATPVGALRVSARRSCFDARASTEPGAQTTRGEVERERERKREGEEMASGTWVIYRILRVTIVASPSLTSHMRARHCITISLGNCRLLRGASAGERRCRKTSPAVKCLCAVPVMTDRVVFVWVPRLSVLFVVGGDVGALCSQRLLAARGGGWKE